MTKAQNLKIALAINSIVQIVDDDTLKKINPYINKIIEAMNEIGVDDRKAGDTEC